MNLIFEYDDLPRTGRIRRAAVDRYRVRPGETLQVSVVVDAYRGPSQVLTAALKIPDATPPGTLTHPAAAAGRTTPNVRILRRRG